MVAEPLETRLRPRRQPRQRRSEQTRARILDAARQVFAERGYSGGTTNHIAAAAQVSVGSLYQYFPNKDAILVELVEGHIEDGRQAIVSMLAGADLEALARTDALIELLRRVVDAFVDLHARDRRLHQVLFEESPRPPALLERLRRIEAEAVAAVAALLDAAGVGAGSSTMRARVTVVAIESAVHRLVAGDETLEPAAVAAEVTAMVCGYLGLEMPGASVSPPPA